MKSFVFLCTLMLFSGCGMWGGDSSSSSTYETQRSSGELQRMTTAPAVSIPDEEEVAVVNTPLGNIVLRFFENDAPKAVENFKTHAKNGYYANTIFHRVINGFMIQGGDPQGTGMGGESIWGKGFETEFSQNTSNKRGTIAMANAGGLSTNGSQFFINQVDNTFLDTYANGQKKNCEMRGVSCHTVFGEVISGLDIVDKIAAQKVGANDKPLKDIAMTINIVPYSSVKPQ